MNSKPLSLIVVLLNVLLSSSACGKHPQKPVEYIMPSPDNQGIPIDSNTQSPIPTDFVEPQDEMIRQFNEENDKLPDNKRLRVADFDGDVLVEKSTGFRMGLVIKKYPPDKRGKNLDAVAFQFKEMNGKIYQVDSQSDVIDCDNPLLEIFTSTPKYIYFHLYCTNQKKDRTFDVGLYHRASKSLYHLYGADSDTLDRETSFTCLKNLCKQITPTYMGDHTNKPIRYVLELKYSNQGFDCVGDFEGDSSCPTPQETTLVQPTPAATTR